MQNNIDNSFGHSLLHVISAGIASSQTTFDNKPLGEKKGKLRKKYDDCASFTTMINAMSAHYKLQFSNMTQQECKERVIELTKHRNGNDIEET